MMSDHLHARRVTLAVTLIAHTLLCAPAWAQSPRRTAAEWATVGVERFKAKDYAGAIEAFESGYELSSDPQFLFNVAVSQQRLGRYRDAQATLVRINALHTLDPVQDATLTGLSRANDLVERAEVIASASALRTERAAPEDRPRDEPVRGLGLLGWTLAAAGGASLITSGVFAYSASDHLTSVQRARSRGDEAAYAVAREELESDQRVGGALLLAGTAFVIAGTALVIVEYTDRDDEQARLRVTLHPQGASLVWRWR